MPYVSIYVLCCGTRAGTAGTVNFGLSGTRTVMRSGSGTGFGLGSNIKCNTNIKNKKIEADFLGNNAASGTERQDFAQIFCC
jgi:hypothetical protein